MLTQNKRVGTISVNMAYKRQLLPGADALTSSRVLSEGRVFVLADRLLFLYFLDIVSVILYFE